MNDSSPHGTQPALRTSVAGPRILLLDIDGTLVDYHNVLRAEALFGDIGVAQGTKATAVAALLAHLGAQRSDTIAFGDATVDLPMFEACGYGVAMGNASDDLLAVADLVTDDVEDDGLAHAFSRLGLV